MGTSITHVTGPAAPLTFKIERSLFDEGSPPNAVEITYTDRLHPDGFVQKFDVNFTGEEGTLDCRCLSKWIPNTKEQQTFDIRQIKGDSELSATSISAGELTHLVLNAIERQDLFKSTTSERTVTGYLFSLRDGALTTLDIKTQEVRRSIFARTFSFGRTAPLLFTITQEQGPVAADLEEKLEGLITDSSSEEDSSRSTSPELDPNKPATAALTGPDVNLGADLQALLETPADESEEAATSPSETQSPLPKLVESDDEGEARSGLVGPYTGDAFVVRNTSEELRAALSSQDVAANDDSAPAAPQDEEALARAAREASFEQKRLEAEKSFEKLRARLAQRESEAAPDGSFVDLGGEPEAGEDAAARTPRPPTPAKAATPPPEVLAEAGEGATRPGKGKGRGRRKGAPHTPAGHQFV